MTEDTGNTTQRNSFLSSNAWPATIIVSVPVVLGIAYFVLRGQDNHPFQAGYVGPSRCAECHPRQFESWKSTRMSQSFEVLKAGVVAERKRAVGLDPDADYTHQPECVGCHATGYGKVGGFVSIEATPDLAGVTCEACHGAGGMYAGTTMSAEDPSFKVEEVRAAGLVYPPTAEVCTTCHNDRSPFVSAGYQFEFEERVKRGTHQHFTLKYRHD